MEFGCALKCIHIVNFKWKKFIGNYTIFRWKSYNFSLKIISFFVQNHTIFATNSANSWFWIEFAVKINTKHNGRWKFKHLFPTTLYQKPFCIENNGMLLFIHFKNIRSTLVMALMDHICAAVPTPSICLYFHLFIIQFVWISIRWFVHSIKRKCYN